MAVTLRAHRLRLPRDSVERSAAAAAAEIHSAVTELIVTHNPDLRRRRAALLQQERHDGVRRRPGRRRGPAGRRRARPAGVEYGPHEVKMAVTGYGRAPKDQVQRWSRHPGHDESAPARRRRRCARRCDLPRRTATAPPRDRLASGGDCLRRGPVAIGADSVVRRGRRRRLSRLLRARARSAACRGRDVDGCTRITWCARTTRRSTASGRPRSWASSSC